MLRCNAVHRCGSGGGDTSSGVRSPSPFTSAETLVPWLPSPRLLFLLLAVTIAGEVHRPAAGTRPARAGDAFALADTITVDGSNGVMPLAAALAEAYQRLHPGRVIALGGGLGSGARLAALRERRIDIALASHGLDTTALRAEGFAPLRVATTAVVFGVNDASPARAITSAQACALLTGSAPTWSVVTGSHESVAMTVHARSESEVDMEVLRRGIACLTNIPVAPHVQVAPDTDAMRRALLASPGAIGVTTATVVQQERGRLRALALDGVAPTADAVRAGRYALARDSYFIASATPSAVVAHFIAWVRSPAAQPVLAANGAVAPR